MVYLIVILVLLVLFVGFLILTTIEKKRGKRVLEGARSSLDASVSKVTTAARSMDPLAFMVSGARIVGSHIVHDIANVAWGLVRMLERTLAGMVKKLRAMRHKKPSSEETTGNTVG